MLRCTGFSENPQRGEAAGFHVIEEGLELLEDNLHWRLSADLEMQKLVVKMKDELEKITSVNYYNNPYQDRGVDDVIYSQRYLRDNSALIEYRKRWMEPEIRDYSYLSEGNLNVIYNALLPSIKLLTSGNVPRKMFITGASSSVSQGPLSDTNWHQDYNPGALYYSPQSSQSSSSPSSSQPSSSPSPSPSSGSSSSLLSFSFFESLLPL